jgi:TP901 family phage tail tape measure protein
MPDFAVSVAIRGDDQMSDNLRRLTKGVDRFGRSANVSFGMASRAAGVFKSVVGGILMSNVIGAGFNAMRLGASEAVRGFIDMDQALTSAGAKFQLSRLGAEGASSAMQALTAAARATGAVTEFTATEAAQGLEFLAMAGFTAEQAIAALPTMVDLATASNSDFARASDIASDALGAFGLASKDAQTQAQNLKRITDVFAQTTAGANVDMENLFETMKMGGPIMTTAGQSLESFAAMAAIMGNAGIKGSLAGTTMKNTVDRLVKPVGEAKTMLKKLGVATQDSGGNMRDVADILADFAEGTKDMGTAQRAAAISTVFGMRAVSGIATILDSGIPTLREFRSELENSGGASKRMADEMRQSLGNRIKVLKSGLMELGIKFIDAFKDKFPGAIDSAIKAVGAFDITPIVNGIKDVISFIKSAWEWFDKWKTTVFALISAFYAFKIALALTSTLTTLIALATGATTITALWAKSQWAVNLAMLANPVTWLILGFMAFIATIVLLIVYWDEIVAAWDAGLSSMSDGTNETANFIAGAFASITTPVVNAAIAIGNAFGEVWHNIKSGVASAVSFVISAWGRLKGSLGFDISDLPSAQDVEGWFGTDVSFTPTDYLEKEDATQGYKDAFASAADFLGAEKSMGNYEPPNRAQRDASTNDISLSGVIDILSPRDMGASGRSNTKVNGQQAPGVNWRSKGGQNTGAK